MLYNHNSHNDVIIASARGHFVGVFVLCCVHSTRLSCARRWSIVIFSIAVGNLVCVTAFITTQLRNCVTF